MLEHVTETSWPDNTDCLYRIKAEYVQEVDNYSLSDNDNFLEIGTEPGGYFYIKTERWAFDNVDELIRILNDFQSKFKFSED